MRSTTMAHVRMTRICLWLLAAMIAFGAGTASAARIKDLARVRGVQSAQVVGLGLVIGLNRTGDRTTSVPFTRQMVENMLRRTGLTFEGRHGFLDTDNVAAVMVTADIAPFTRQGTEFDVQVSSIGDARSLYGGLLLKTSLMLGGEEVAVAQGSVTTGGFQAAAIGSHFQRNSVTTANVPNGGILVADIRGGELTTPDPNASDPATAAQTLTLGLHNPDFTTAARVADAVNGSVGANSAVAIDAATIRIVVPATSQAGIVQFISAI